MVKETRTKHPLNAKKPKQLSFDSKEFIKPKDEFGGSLLKGNNPKVKRPLSTTLPLHLCLRSNFSTLRLPKNYGKVHKEIYRCAKKYGIKIYKYANVGNHIHLLIRLTKLKLWAKFIRELTSNIAKITNKNINQRITNGVTNREIKSDQKKNEKDLNTNRVLEHTKSEKKFWKHRPFTRIIQGWRKAFKTMKDYVYLNQIEAEGHISRKDIKTLKDLRILLDSG